MLKGLDYDWVAYKNIDRVYYVNESEKISTYTVPRGTPPRKVQKVVQSLGDTDGKKSLKKHAKQRPPPSFAEGCLLFVADKEHVCRMALNRGAEFYAGDPARLEFYDGDKLSNKVCD
jgi:hypothetical protein